MLNLRSKAAQRVLGYFMLHPDAEMYVNQMCRRFNVDRGNLVRKLMELEKEGILVSHWKGNQRYYRLNPAFPLIKEYKKIILKTIGLEYSLKEALSKVEGVKEAMLFGSYAKNKMDSASDLDLIVVGSHSTLALQRQIAKLQKEIDREINVISYGSAEYEIKKKGDSFLRSILKKKRVILL